MATRNKLEGETSRRERGESTADESQPDDINLDLEARGEKLREREGEPRLARERYAALFDLAPIAHLCLDEDGRIVEANRAAAELFRTEASRLCGRSLSTFMSRDSANTLSRVLLDVFSNGNDHQVRLVIEVGDEAIRIPILMRAARGVAGPLSVCHCVLSDESDAEAAERERERLAKERDAVTHQLHQSQKMEALGTLASGIAHDFNNLLMGILSCADVARSAVAGTSSAHLYLDEIWRSASHGAKIARQLLLFARKRPETAQTFELTPAICGLHSLLSRLLGDAIEVRMDLQAPSHCCISADPVQLEQVILNLAVNARDAMPEGGVLTIATRHASIGDTPAVALRISDTGVGMDDECRARAFEPFFTTKDLGRGTGLGLSTVHGIVMQAGGEIDIDSAPGRGTIVEIRFPISLAKPTVTTETPLSGRPPSLRGTVLLVEDDSLVRMGIRFYLESFGVRVLAATSGLEAIQCCEHFPGAINVLLTDLMLPDLSGAKIADEIRARLPGVAVVYMSALPEAPMLSQGRAIEGEHFLQKPFQAQVLYRELQPYLSSDRLDDGDRRPTERSTADGAATAQLDPHDSQPLRLDEIEDMFTALRRRETAPSERKRSGDASNGKPTDDS